MWEDGNPATLRKHRGFAAATASLPVLFIPFFFLGACACLATSSSGTAADDACSLCRVSCRRRQSIGQQSNGDDPAKARHCHCCLQDSTGSRREHVTSRHTEASRTVERFVPPRPTCVKTNAAAAACVWIFAHLHLARFLSHWGNAPGAASSVVTEVQQPVSGLRACKNRSLAWVVGGALANSSAPVEPQGVWRPAGVHGDPSGGN